MSTLRHTVVCQRTILWLNLDILCGLVARIVHCHYRYLTSPLFSNTHYPPCNFDTNTYSHPTSSSPDTPSYHHTSSYSTSHSSTGWPCHIPHMSKSRADVTSSLYHTVSDILVTRNKCTLFSTIAVSKSHNVMASSATTPPILTTLLTIRTYTWNAGAILTQLRTV